MEDVPSSAVDEQEQTPDDPERSRAALERLVERGQALREQARTYAARDSELTAARQELYQHAQGLTEELELVVREHLAAIAREDERTARIVESLQERGRSLTTREQDLVGKHERIRASEAELEERKRRLEELRAQLASLEQRIAHEETLKAERASESERQRARGETLLAGERRLAEQQAELERRRAELEPAKAALAEREAVAAQREVELAQRAKGIAARELLARRVEPAAPAPPVDPGRRFTIERLERLVSARRNEFPDRVSEWDAYLFQLRPQSATDGLLPERLTGLIEEVFAPLL